MGDHYVPQKYLSAWCVPGEKAKKIWAYDRVEKKTYLSSVRGVAQENGFYTEEDEKKLNELVEQPANGVLDKLRGGDSLDESDREKLALYMATQIRRVPHIRELSLRAAPEILENSTNKFRVAARSGELQLGTTEETLREIDDVYNKYYDRPADLIMDAIRSPWASEEIVTTLLQMTWRYLSPKDTSSSNFITSDNPVFFFSGFGVRQAKSEISFPISPILLLHGCSAPLQNGRYEYEIPERDVKVLNQRPVSKATRYLFYPEQVWWMETLRDKVIQERDLKRYIIS